MNQALRLAVLTWILLVCPDSRAVEKAAPKRAPTTEEVKRWIEELKDPSAEVRSSAAARAILALRAILRDKDWPVRVAAAKALKKIEEKRPAGR